MARKRQRPTVREVAEVAAAVFIENGYRRTRVADVARAMGVAKGTMYLYAESKGALFAVAARHGDPLWRPPSGEGPIATPAAGSTVAYLVGRLGRDGRFPLLSAAAATTTAQLGMGADVRAELRAILGEMYDTFSRHRVTIKMVDRCAPDLPELAEAFCGFARVALPTLIREYLERRGDAVRPMIDTAIVARSVVETLSFWAIHHHWDPAPSDVEPEKVRDTVIELLCNGLVT